MYRVAIITASDLPESPKVVKEKLDIIVDSLDHGLDILKGNAMECTRK